MHVSPHAPIFYGNLGSKILCQIPFLAEPSLIAFCGDGDQYSEPEYKAIGVNRRPLKF